MSDIVKISHYNLNVYRFLPLRSSQSAFSIYNLSCTARKSANKINSALTGMCALIRTPVNSSSVLGCVLKVGIESRCPIKCCCNRLSPARLDHRKQYRFFPLKLVTDIVPRSFAVVNPDKICLVFKSPKKSLPLKLFDSLKFGAEMYWCNQVFICWWLFGGM